MSVKNKTNDVLLEFYKTNSYEFTLAVAKKMLESKSYAGKRKFNSDLHGEICETVLEISIMEYMKLYPEKCKDWFYEKGLILKDINNPDSEFLTELDLVLFTPTQICIFECKSYNSDKTLEKECTIVNVNGKSFDAYKQNLLHKNILVEQFTKFSVNKIVNDSMCRMYLFNFSLGKTVDNRTKENKVKMPHITTKSIFSLLDSLCDGKIFWRIDYLKRAIQIINKHKKRNTKKHLDYVKSLHSKR